MALCMAVRSSCASSLPTLSRTSPRGLRLRSRAAVTMAHFSVACACVYPFSFDVAVHTGVVIPWQPNSSQATVKAALRAHGRTAVVSFALTSLPRSPHSSVGPRKPAHA